MHAGREEAPLSCARDEGDEARLRGCLLFLSIHLWLCRWEGTFVSHRCFGRCSMLVRYRTTGAV